MAFTSLLNVIYNKLEASFRFKNDKLNSNYEEKNFGTFIVEKYFR
mgnify:CR=1 FL=1